MVHRLRRAQRTLRMRCKFGQAPTARGRHHLIGRGECHLLAGGLSELRELYVDRNSIRMLPDGIQHLYKLRVLDLSHNLITVVGVFPIPGKSKGELLRNWKPDDVWQRIDALRFGVVHRNRRTGDLRTFPPSGATVLDVEIERLEKNFDALFSRGADLVRQEKFPNFFHRPDCLRQCFVVFFRIPFA